MLQEKMQMLLHSEAPCRIMFIQFVIVPSPPILVGPKPYLLYVYLYSMHGEYRNYGTRSVQRDKLNKWFELLESIR